ncbi:hypothetical protein CB0101_10430 [Synechococcus sp. CB0101]|uniref:hypothetical protein n=1 Tax=Synechococcus sp. CB0101 TaxID=232348 RepID=UPI0010AA0685|nr:hypothetical protein [Synechococcus sp. CB0101]QCH15293.1 hypothetical protein CB0101_10430 [Synechococcus sp. CB0101]
MNSLPSSAVAAGAAAAPADGAPRSDEAAPEMAPDPVLCGHCGRTASNGLVCIGACVADSGY